jgi:RNA polymerase sigma factor (TIGR02999 family)
VNPVEDITSLLAAARHGDIPARDRAFALLYAELGRLARAKLRAESTFTNLDVTALVHESYIRLAQAAPGRWENRRAFFAYASSVMRSVIVDVARERNAQKRGSGLRSLTLTTGVAEDVFAIEEVAQLDCALQALKKVDAQLLEIVEMRYFAGLTIEDIAGLLELSPTTIKRKWQTARAFLYTELQH